MYLSIPIITLLLTTALGASLKRQNGVPACINGDTSTINRPGKLSQFHALLTIADPAGGGCSEGCFMTEQDGDRVGLICKGRCVDIPIWGGGIRSDCYN
ncbi:hypothetical protein BDW02DRAFT_498660 [Decorospora gaudefroyi]|uniref:Uncharacterized protein n=1 Tax=Decorospora gaudefroyi TaxID=184978 RepID=A0A6A5KLA7_9PLEO|nr:hypothetical protein BDW02DRAFT_498660 [Decorospora gaudefroyi]